MNENAHEVTIGYVLNEPSHYLKQIEFQMRVG